MVKITMLEKIRDLKRKGYKRFRVARELGIDIKTVNKYWDMSDDEYLNYYKQTKVRNNIMEPYKDFIVDKIKEYSEITSAIIYDNLLETYKNFNPSYRSTRRYVAALREELGIPSALKVRQYNEVAQLPFGAQAQVDMGQKVMKDQYGKSVKVYIFAMVMSNSRYKFIYLQAKPFNAKEFVNAHDLAFKYFGGRPEEIVYDQDRVMVVSENSGDIIYTDVFKNYIDYAGFSIRLCRGSDPESKGKIEAVIKYVKYNFLSCRIYYGESRLNSDVISWLDRTGNNTIHETTKMIPKIIFREEQKHLKSVPELGEKIIPAQIVQVRKTNVVNYKQNRYAMPIGTYKPNKKVRIEVDEENNRLNFFDVETGELIQVHQIADGVGKYIRNKHSERDRTNYLELKKSIIEGFAGIEEAFEFVEKIINIKGRYARDQLSLLKKCQQKYSVEELSFAINYCIEKNLYSAVDYTDTLEYFKKTPKEEAIAKIVIPIKYRVVTANEREINAYTSIYEGELAK